LIVRWPIRIPANRVDEDSVVTAVDFMPTLCRFAGVELPEDYAGDGEDVSDVLTVGSRPRRQPIMWEWRFRVAGYPFHHSPMLAIRSENWKLLMNPDRSRLELYDVTADRLELNNLVARHPDIVRQLAPRLVEWQATLPTGPADPGAGEVHYGWPRSGNPDQQR
jgi:N-acetylgalactosamine-6-sulfatase